MKRLRKPLLLVAALVAIGLAVGAWLVSVPPADVRADHAAVVNADNAMQAAQSDIDKYRESLDALALRDTFTARHAKEGWRIADDDRLVAPAARTRTAIGLGVGAGVLALAAAIAAFALRRGGHSAAGD